MAPEIDWSLDTNQSITMGTASPEQCAHTQEQTEPAVCKDAMATARTALSVPTPARCVCKNATTVNQTTVISLWQPENVSGVMARSERSLSELINLNGLVLAKLSLMQFQAFVEAIYTPLCPIYIAFLTLWQVIRRFKCPQYGTAIMENERHRHKKVLWL